MKVVGVVQARMQSTRLPGKVLLPVGGRFMLERMLERLRSARELDEIVVATTPLEADRPITALCSALNLRCVTGHPTDLVERHLMVAYATEADALVKVPSDCPLIDPAIVDRVVAVFRDARGAFDYVSNLHPATWPDGNDVEVFTVGALEEAFVQADRLHEREHATPFIWDQPGRYRIGNVEWGAGRDLSTTHRLTVDHHEDFEVVTAVYEAMEQAGAELWSVDDIVTFLDLHPDIREHNGRHRNKGWPADHAHLLRTWERAELLVADLSGGRR